MLPAQQQLAYPPQTQPSAPPDYLAQQTVVPPQQPQQQYVHVVEQPPHGQHQPCCSGYSQTYNVNRGRSTAIAHLVLGIIAIIVNSLSFVFGHHGYPNEGQPIGTAVLLIIPTGILGIVSSKSRSNCTIIAYLVMSILTCLAAIGGVIDEGLAAGLYSYRLVCGEWFYCYWDVFDVAIILHSIGAVVLFAEFITAIVAAVYCCRGLLCCGGCCCPTGDATSTTTNTHDVNTSVHYHHNGVVHTQGQPVYGDVVIKTA